MRKRLLLLRKTLNKTQQEFAETINLKRQAIGSYEKGINIIPERVIKDICREFNVNEHWFRTGEGSMFRPLETNINNRLTKKYAHLIKTDDPYRKALIEEILDSPPEIIEAMAKFCISLSKKIAEAKQESENK